MQPGDVAILDCLRRAQALSVTQMAKLMEVTATAIRQRLTRLTALGLIERQARRQGRGRPTFEYQLTEEGRRKTGSNFADLALALWSEVRSIEDKEVRRGLLQRLASRMAELYAHRINGKNLENRMREVASFFVSREVPFEVDSQDGLPVLKAFGCPYTELAEKDRSICAMERMLFTELIGEKLNLSSCRLDGGACCTFELDSNPQTDLNREPQPHQR